MHHLELRDLQSIDPVVLSMRADELDKCDRSHEVESDDHPEIAAGNLKSRTFAVENFRVGRGKPYLLHRIPLGGPHQGSPTEKRHLRLSQYVPKTGTLQDKNTRRGKHRSQLRDD